MRKTARIEWSFDELRDPEAALAKLTSLSGLPPVAVSMILGSVKSLPNMMIPDRLLGSIPRSGICRMEGCFGLVECGSLQNASLSDGRALWRRSPFKVTINRAGKSFWSNYLVVCDSGIRVSWNCKQVGEVGMRCGQRCRLLLYLSFFLAGGLILPP